MIHIRECDYGEAYLRKKIPAYIFTHSGQSSHLSALLKILKCTWGIENTLADFQMALDFTSTSDQRHLYGHVDPLLIQRHIIAGFTLCYLQMVCDSL